MLEHKFPSIGKRETFAKCSFLFKFKEGENFNHRHTICISRIKLKLHFVDNVETAAEIGQKGAFCKGLRDMHRQGALSLLGFKCINPVRSFCHLDHFMGV
jgi:hypothetical protein